MSSISGVGGFRPPPPGKPPSFEKLDADSDGSLSLDEFKSGAPKGADASKSEALFKSIDSDGDGKVSKAEQEAFKTKAEKADQQLQSFLFQLQAAPAQAGDTAKTSDDEDDAFAKIDADGDGNVSKDEFLKAFSGDDANGKASGSTDAATSSDRLGRLFDAIDSDKNGAISKQEQGAFRQASQRDGGGQSHPHHHRQSASLSASQSYGTTAQLAASNASGTTTFSQAA